MRLIEVLWWPAVWKDLSGLYIVDTDFFRVELLFKPLISFSILWPFCSAGGAAGFLCLPNSSRRCRTDSVVCKMETHCSAVYAYTPLILPVRHCLSALCGVAGCAIQSSVSSGLSHHPYCVICSPWLELFSLSCFRLNLHGESALLREIHRAYDWLGGKTVVMVTGWWSSRRSFSNAIAPTIQNITSIS